MSDINCSACEELRTEAPAFATNGVTSAVCASLKNDTGLSTTNGHNNETDMTDAIDCLIGRMDDELEAYDVCDWKDFMHKWIPNNYETLKALLCSDSGQWTNIHDINEKIDGLCAMIGMATNPVLSNYGIVPYHTDQSHYVGTIGEKNGTPLLTVYPRSDVPDYGINYAGVGIQYARKQFTSCSTGQCENWEWFCPAFYLVTIDASVSDGDILWYVDKASLQAACGISDEFWRQYTISQWTWKDVSLDTDRRNAWIQMTIDTERMGSDYLTLVYRGSSYPNGPVGTTQPIRDSGSFNTRIVITPC